MASAILAAATGAALALRLLASPAGAADVKPPADFEMKQGDNSPGVVVFSHARHLGKVTKCTTCHMKDFRMQRGQSGPITLEAKQEGKFCGACHDGKRSMGGVTVFAIDDCDRCHRP